MLTVGGNAHTIRFHPFPDLFPGCSTLPKTAALSSVTTEEMPTLIKEEMMNENILMNANFIPDKLIVLLIYEAKSMVRIIDEKPIETPEMLFRNIQLLLVFQTALLWQSSTDFSSAEHQVK